MPKDSKEQVEHPDHCNKHPSGVECWDVVRHMCFNLGSAIKYIWRADLKHDDPVTDLRKAVNYLQDEIKLRTGGFAPVAPCEYTCRNYPAGGHAAHCLACKALDETDLAKYKRLLEAAGIEPSYQNNPQTGTLKVSVRGLSHLYFNTGEALQGVRFPFDGACEELEKKAANISPPRKP